MFQSVSQLFHGPAPRSPLHRLADRLRHSRSNTIQYCKNNVRSVASSWSLRRSVDISIEVGSASPHRQLRHGLGPAPAKAELNEAGSGAEHASDDDEHDLVLLEHGMQQVLEVGRRELL